MTTRVCLLIGSLAWAAFSFVPTFAPAADEAPKADVKSADAKDGKADATAGDKVKADAPTASSSGSSGGSSGAAAPKPKYPPHADVLKDFSKIDGLIPLYLKDTKLYA